MDHEIATASADILRVKKRRFRFLSFALFRKISQAIKSPNEEISTVLVAPPIKSEEVLNDIINRFSWYLPPNSCQNITIYVSISEKLSQNENTIVEENTPSPLGQPSYNREGLPVEFLTGNEYSKITSEVDKILIQDMNNANMKILIRNIDRVEIIDPHYYSTIESGAWAQVSNCIRRSTENTSQNTYNQLFKSYKDIDRSFVFATGPSLDNVYDMDIPDDSLCIICNSIVKNKALMEHISPDVLVFADPVFHFGPSKYADEFRKDMRDAVEKFGLYVGIPEYHHSLLSYHYSNIKSQLIGFSIDNTDEFIFPERRELSVRDTGNIMTELMLPIASGLTNEVYIIGADGRQEDESYFWEHSNEAQYDDELMNTVAKTHPSFFRDRIYEDYYEKHTNILKSLIEYGENNGINYHSLTDSHIQCLQERRTDL